MKTRVETLKRGLYSRVVQHNQFDPKSDSPEEIRRWLEKLNGGTPRANDINIGNFRTEANHILRNAGLSENVDSADGLEGNVAFAAEILHELRELDFYRTHGNIEEAVYHAMLAGRLMEQLRANLHFESKVRSREKSAQNIKPRAKVITDDQIRKIIKQGGTRDEQAEALGVTVRTLLRRCKTL
jgi:hypothetical protein